MKKLMFVSFSILALACDGLDPELKEDGEDGAVADVEVIIDIDASVPASIEILEGEADFEEFDALDLDLTAPTPEPLAGYAANSFCTSWHCTKISVLNGAGMPASKEVWFWGDVYHTNNSIDFYWARVEHWVYSEKNQYVGTVSCKYPGDWAKKYKLTCPAAAKGYSGWIIYTRLCADIKDDGKGTRCTSYARTNAVW